MTTSQAWSWSQSRFGGGGYITGLCMDPVNPELLYARSDVAGCFSSRDGGSHWEPMNAGLSEAHEHMVHALAVSPHRPGLLLRCSGDARGGRTYGAIHRSIDHGHSWQEVSRDIDFFGNGPTRMFGEICVFDPSTPDRVLVGGYRSGLWVSEDAGITWRCQGLVSDRIGCVVFHPHQPGLVYVGTVGDSALSGLRYMGEHRRIADVVLEHGDLPRGSEGRLYVSRDSGDTWELIHERKQWSVNGLAFDPSEKSTVVAATCDGVWRSEDGGHRFTQCDLGRGGQGQFNHVDADPHRPGRLLTSPHLDGDTIPLLESLDGGLTWHRLKEKYTLTDLSDYPEYITEPSLIGRAISRVLFSPEDEHSFYMNGYYGVSVTRDNGLTFSGQGFVGIETTCVESIIADRAHERLFVTIADHVPAVSDDGGRTYHVLGPGPHPTAALAASPHDAGLVLWGAGSKRLHNEGCQIVRTTKGGDSAHVVYEFTGRRFVQALASDPMVSGRFYAFIDGDMTETSDSEGGAGVYRSDDRGDSWLLVTSPFPDTVHRLPVEEAWIESEFLPVVVYQKRNAAGANQLLVCDPHCADTVYVGEWTLGLYRSDDAGRSWQQIDAGLPFGITRVGVLSHIVVDPARPGWLYVGFTQHGLWRSTDRGHTWQQITDTKPLNATSVAVAGQRIAIACEPMWWTDTPARILLSDDLGQTWNDIHPTHFGAVRWKGIALDSAGGIHASSCGNGIFRASPQPRPLVAVPQPQQV